MREFTMGSLFAGIGGFDLGFERAGFTTKWQVEIDPFATKVLAKNFPHAQRFGDIRTVGVHNLEPVDVICGGFPCQDISNAGKRAGIEGARSGLVTEGIRVIRELRPRFVLLENVAALLARGLGEVLGYLAEIGYDAEWDIVSAADAGAPHLRQRVWILAYPAMRGRHDSCTANRLSASGRDCPSREAGGCGGDVADDPSSRRGTGWSRGFDSGSARESEQPLQMADSARLQQGWEIERPKWQRVGASSEPGAECAGEWESEPNVGRVAHGIPARVDRLRCLGNAVVPQIPELFARRIRAVLEADHAR